MCDAPPNLEKGPLLATKRAINRVFVGGLRGGGVRFKKSTFGGFCTSPRFDPGHGPELPCQMAGLIIHFRMHIKVCKLNRE